MSLILEVDDLSQGMFVAVHSIKHPRFVHERGNHSGIEDPSIDSSSPIPLGVPLRIIGVSVPFAACAIVQPGGEEGGPVILDVRKVRLSRLTSEFVNSIIAFDSENCVSEDTDAQEHVNTTGE